MKVFFRFATYLTITLTSGVFIETSLRIATAWVEPQDGQNITAPLNTSSQNQTKQGGMILNTSGNPNGLIIDKGKVGIDTNNPQAALDVNGDITTNGSLGIGTANPKCKVDIAQNGSLKVGQAYLSSGGDYAHLSNNEWYDGSRWNSTAPGALLQLVGQALNIYKHDTTGNHTNLMSLDSNGRLSVTGGICLNGDCRGNWPVDISITANAPMSSPCGSHLTAGATCPSGYSIVDAKLSGNNNASCYCIVNDNGILLSIFSFGASNLGHGGTCIGICQKNAY